MKWEKFSDLDYCNLKHIGLGSYSIQYCESFIETHQFCLIYDDRMQLGYFKTMKEAKEKALEHHIVKVNERIEFFQEYEKELK